MIITVSRFASSLVNYHKITKAKIKLSLSQQQEWLQYFEEQKLKANNIQQHTKQTDKEIDDMVYELYGLSEKEIGVVEGKKIF